jgi:hypothetical protein
MRLPTCRFFFLNVFNNAGDQGRHGLREGARALKKTKTKFSTDDDALFVLLTKCPFLKNIYCCWDFFSKK